MVSITDKIKYIESSNEPLSAEIGVIESNGEKWLFDVGNDKTKIEDLTETYNVVLSHFHLDHIGNLNNLKINKLYVSKYTYEHTNKGIIVEDNIYINNLHIFLVPSSHTKGCLGLEVDEEYAFLGDGIYSKSNDEFYIYNVQLLKEEIDLLKKLKANKLLVSHERGFILDKEVVLIMLEQIYALREKDNPLILVPKR